MTLQTQASLDREAKFAARIEQAFDVKLRRISEFDRFDYFGVDARERVTCAFELKCRNTTREQYSTVFLSLRKWTDLMLQSMRGVTPYFAAEWADGSAAYVDITMLAPGRPVMRGRKDRGLENDMEPMLEVCIADMELLPTFVNVRMDLQMPPLPPPPEPPNTVRFPWPKRAA